MTIAHEFAYRKAVDVPEALALLDAHAGRARVLAGGTDVVPWLRDDAIQPEIVIDIKGIAGLDAITVDEDRIHIGALATFTDLLESTPALAAIPLLGEMAGTVASTGIRNRATLAGNICSAVASCDAGPSLLVIEGSVEVAGPSGPRSIPLDAWFVGNRETALGFDELVTGITLQRPPDPHGAAYARLSRYDGEDLAQAGVAVLVAAGPTYRVAFGAVGPVPHRSARIEAILQAGAFDESTIRAAVAAVPEEISPITDVRASHEYRELMSRVMLERALRAAMDRMAGAGPSYGTPLL